MKKIIKFILVFILFTIMSIPLKAEEKTAELITGPELRNKFIELTGAMEVYQYKGKDFSVKQILRAESLPDDFNPTSQNILSLSTSEYPIYAWFVATGTYGYWSTGIIYYYSEADKIYLNSNSESMFSRLSELTTIDLSGFDTSRVTNMGSMFEQCENLESVDVSDFDTKNVTNMSGMFYGCEKLITIDVSNFDTRNVTYMGGMFSGCSSLTNLDVSNFDTSKVVKMNNIFKNCGNLTDLILSSFDTSNVDNMYGMFEGCYGLTSLDLSNFDTSKVTDMSRIFYNCGGLTTLDISNFDTSNVTKMSSMFSGCSSLTNLDVSNFNTSKVTDMSFMFQRIGTQQLDLSGFNTSKVTDMDYMFTETKMGNIDLSNFDTSKVQTMEGMFSHSNFVILDLSHFNILHNRNIRYMFNGCSNLAELDITGFKIQNRVTIDSMGCDADYSGIFDQTPSLETIYVRGASDKDKLIKLYSGKNFAYKRINEPLKIKITKYEDGWFYHKVTWPNQPSIEQYIVYKSTDNKNWKKVYTTSDKNFASLTYYNLELTYGKKTYVKVKGVGELNSVMSNVITITAKPNKPNISIYSAGTNNIKIDIESNDANRADIYISTDNKKWTKVGTKKDLYVLGGSYNIKKLKENKKYYIKIRPYKLEGSRKTYGSYSNVVSTKTAPNTPSLKIKIKDYNKLKITVGDVKGVSYYQVQKSLNGENYSDLITLNGSTSYTDEELNLGWTYYYRVRACNSQKRCSGWSKASMKQTTLTPKFTLSTSSKIVKVVLDEVSMADGYQIYRSTSKKGKYSKIKEFSSEVELLEYVNKTKKGKTYYYKVRSFALNESGKRVYSPYSKIKSIRSK